MEYEKTGEKFSFGFGSNRVAGSGKIPKTATAKPTKKKIFRKILTAGTQIGVFIIIRKVIKNKE
ncbi:MAG: hypothetical protein K2J08_11555 [Ruminococcus sp.]|nr:hypothetical protein [Ruminococcus sp.]